MVDLSVEISGITFKNPLIVAAGPNTKNYFSALNCIRAGFGAIVIRSLHLRHLNDSQVSIREFWNVYGGKNLQTDLYSLQSTGAPALRINSKLDPGFGGAAPMPRLEQYQEEVFKITKAAKEYGCVTIGSLGWCGTGLSDEDVWKTEAMTMTEAGVEMLQLHTAPSPATETGRYMNSNPRTYLEGPIKIAKSASKLPVYAKLPVDCCDTISVAGVAQKAGADGVVPVTRWVSLPLDIENEKLPVWRGPGIGGPWSVPIMRGLIYRMRHHAVIPISYIHERGKKPQLPQAVPVTIPIIPSGGVRCGEDVIGYIMAGGNAAEICAQVILEGVGVLKRIEGEMRSWMERKGYSRVSEFHDTIKLLEPSQVKDIPQWVPSVDQRKCTGCGNCIDACTNGALFMHGNVAELDIERCEGCTSCGYICPSGAISLQA